MFCFRYSANLWLIHWGWRGKRSFTDLFSSSKSMTHLINLTSAIKMTVEGVHGLISRWDWLCSLLHWRFQASSYSILTVDEINMYYCHGLHNNTEEAIYDYSKNQLLLYIYWLLIGKTRKSIIKFMCTKTYLSIMFYFSGFKESFSTGLEQRTGY